MHYFSVFGFLGGDIEVNTGLRRAGGAPVSDEKTFGLESVQIIPTHPLYRAVRTRHKSDAGVGAGDGAGAGTGAGVGVGAGACFVLITFILPAHW